MRGILALAVAFLALAMVAQAAYPYSWTVIGDWGRPIRHAKTIATTSNKAGSRFTCAIGDNFYMAGVKSTHDSKWKTVFENVYTQPFFQKRWYVIAGNHDYRGSIKAQIDYTKQSKRWHFPSKYYKVTKNLGSGKTVDLVFIDTTPFYEFKKRDPTQLQWIENTLKSSTATWVIVLGHHQIYSLGGNSRYLSKFLNPLLVKNKVAAYVCGHHHSLQHHVSKDLHYLVVGNGAMAKPPPHTSLGVPSVKTQFSFCNSKQYKQLGRPNCMGYAIFKLVSDNTLKVFMYNSQGKLLHTAKVNNPR